jgi:ribosome-associated heat shock protein Hsp15
MTCRIDKFLWAVRLTKTRSQATELVNKRKVQLNQQEIKPSKEVKIGDTISIQRNTAVFSYKVLQVIDKRVGPKLVPESLSDITPQEEVDKFKAYQLAQQSYRQYGTGKPSKKDRRDLDDFLDW